MPVDIYSCCHGKGTYVSLAIKNPKFVSLTCVLVVLVTKGSRVLEKKESETQVSKLSSATLKAGIIQAMGEGEGKACSDGRYNISLFDG